MPELQASRAAADLNSFAGVCAESNGKAGSEALFVLNVSAIYGAASQFVRIRWKRQHDWFSFDPASFSLSPALCQTLGHKGSNSQEFKTVFTTRNLILLRVLAGGISAFRHVPSSPKDLSPLSWPPHRGFLALLSELACTWNWVSSAMYFKLRFTNCKLPIWLLLLRNQGTNIKVSYSTQLEVKQVTGSLNI